MPKEYFVDDDDMTTTNTVYICISTAALGYICAIAAAMLNNNPNV